MIKICIILKQQKKYRKLVEDYVEARHYRDSLLKDIRRQNSDIMEQRKSFDSLTLVPECVKKWYDLYVSMVRFNRGMTLDFLKKQLKKVKSLEEELVVKYREDLDLLYKIEIRMNDRFKYYRD